MSRERDGDQLDIVPIRFQRDRLWILDQTLLPVEEKWRELTTKEEVWDSIYKLQVRGAPAIAKYGTAKKSEACGTKNPWLPRR